MHFESNAKIQKSLLLDLRSFLSPAHPFEVGKSESCFAEAAGSGRCTLGRDKGHCAVPETPCLPPCFGLWGRHAGGPNFGRAALCLTRRLQVCHKNVVASFVTTGHRIPTAASSGCAIHYSHDGVPPFPSPLAPPRPHSTHRCHIGILEGAEMECVLPPSDLIRCAACRG